jgi:hypothetical protein
VNTEKILEDAYDPVFKSGKNLSKYSQTIQVDIVNNISDVS